nr:aldehyde ferredoxin oxidoreductase [Desulfobacterales bacterium]NIU81566.1 aldehyde ferredoxin oxidoreductase [Candidatus Bathyarchaeota archaeon]NIV68203.1 aldehyde ferredoxin oxidoreductase [Candidatus Bathyarchaeota archaeon]NIW16581.1 aldehyde ferredoxin oxidoreductase [Candidatus Bathyarchaeota archaeon]
YWGLGALETEERLRKEYGRTVGVVTIGPAGENLVKFANVVSQEGRAGGRPGMGAVMGSKNLKALVLKGSKTIPVADSDRLKELGKEGYREVLEKPNYEFWKRQGTMATIEWSQENSVLPTQNFREGVFDEAEDIGGFAMEELKVSQRGCPQCNMTCGNVIEDAEGQESELDYENVAMLGSNIGLGHLKQVGVLNRLADDYGLDTISLGNVLGFAMEASEKGLLDYRIEWGDFQAAKALTEDIVHRRGVGSVLAEGTQAAAQKLGGEASTWAMNIKSLEITGYDCHAAPGMALSFGTSPIGAHHKDAWVISWEMKVGRGSYTEAKVEKVIEFQRIRGGIFECLTTCRLPWIEVGFKLEWYPKFLKAATGMDLSLGDLFRIADRVYSLMRAFWVREYGKAWDHKMDVPPARWFRQPLTEGPFKGATLDREKYQDMLQRYYRKRGWDQRGVPTKNTLAHLGLPEVAEELSQYIKLTP